MREREKERVTARQRRSMKTPPTPSKMTRSLIPNPYALHPTPYTLHPAPCNLHPTPQTINPQPDTRHAGRALLDGLHDHRHGRRKPSAPSPSIQAPLPTYAMHPVQSASQPLPGRWLQCQVNGSNVCRVPSQPACRRWLHDYRHGTGVPRS